LPYFIGLYKKDEEVEMILVLHREYTGKQIVEAFKRAISFETTPEKKWVHEEFTDEKRGRIFFEPSQDRYEMRDGELKLLPPERIGVAVYPAFLIERRKWIIFGKKKKVWTSDADTVFVLSPLTIGEMHSAMKVEIKAAFYGDEGKRYDVIEPERRGNPHKGLFEKFISAFLEELKRGEEK
jgi:hypothetical protein